MKRGEDVEAYDTHFTHTQTN